MDYDLPIDSDLDVDEDASGRPAPAHLRPALVGLVWLGGALGTTSRYLLGLALPPLEGIPVTTAAINVVGAFVLGAVLGALSGRHGERRSRAIRVFCGTGFLGGFTTYSALAVDCAHLAGSGRVGAAAAYALITLVVGGVASLAGIAIGEIRRPERPGMIVLNLVAVAGGLGAVSRFVLDGLVRSWTRTTFPLGTLIINVSGSLLLGLLSGLVAREALPVDWRVIGGIGFLGGYTTFSTASFETVRLLQERRRVAALVNGLGVLALSCGAAGLGLLVAAVNFA